MKSNGNKNVASAVKELISPLANEMGFYLWDVEFVKEGADKYLRITIDNEEGITIIDCESFHRAIDPLLDEADPISESYILEVSSPGIDRPLRTEEHFARFAGEQVALQTTEPINGRGKWTGTLCGMEGDDVIIEVEGERTAIPFASVKKANIKGQVDFTKGKD